jgi:DNA-binding FrmR family transcriptional regulator
VRGLQAMVEEDRYCADPVTQISSVHGADRADAMYDTLIDLIYTHSR